MSARPLPPPIPKALPAKSNPLFTNDGPPVSYDELVLPFLQPIHSGRLSPLRKVLLAFLGLALFAWGWIAGAYWKSKAAPGYSNPSLTVNNSPKESPAPPAVTNEPLAPSLPPQSQAATAAPAPAAPNRPVASGASTIPKVAPPKVAPAPWKSIPLDSCKIVGTGEATIRVNVGPDGTITGAEGDTALEKCIAKRLQGKIGFLPNSDPAQTLTIKLR